MKMSTASVWSEIEAFRKGVINGYVCQAGGCCFHGKDNGKLAPIYTRFQTLARKYSFTRP